MTRKQPKPRDPYVQHLVKKKQGAHINKKQKRQKKGVKMTVRNLTEEEIVALARG